LRRRTARDIAGTSERSGGMGIEGEVGRHSLFEDALAFANGTLLVTLGVSMYAHAQLLTGGTAGIALLGLYATGWPFGAIFFVVNLPFYALAVLRMGWSFAIRTFVAVALVSVLSRLVPGLIGFGFLDPVYAAVMGGASIGVGLLIFFRHRAGLGGFNILAVFLQERFGLRAGLVLLGVDLAIMAAAFAVLEWRNVALSVLGAVVINVIIAVNHRPGRYMGMS
jgi:uncharacterized membrane-anchored protein YitT (DUF2179 family)